jgi:hypothetical protein
MVEHRFCNPRMGVRFSHGAPVLGSVQQLKFFLCQEAKNEPVVFSPISEMASPVVWDHEAQVRFLHRRPVMLRVMEVVYPLGLISQESQVRILHPLPVLG